MNIFKRKEKITPGAVYVPEDNDYDEPCDCCDEEPAKREAEPSLEYQVAELQRRDRERGEEIRFITRALNDAKVSLQKLAAELSYEVREEGHYSEPRATFRGEVNAILKHLGMKVVVKTKETEVKLEKGKK